jgi:hypothetical protein
MVELQTTFLKILRGDRQVKVQVKNGAKPIKIIEMPAAPTKGQLIYLPEEMQITDVVHNNMGPVIFVSKVGYSGRI